MLGNGASRSSRQHLSPARSNAGPDRRHSPRTGSQQPGAALSPGAGRALRRMTGRRAPLVLSESESDGAVASDEGSGAGGAASGAESSSADDGSSPSEDETFARPARSPARRRKATAAARRRLQLAIPSSDAAHEADLYARRAGRPQPRYNFRDRASQLKKEIHVLARSPAYKLRNRGKHYMLQPSKGMVAWSSVDVHGMVSASEDSGREAAEAAPRAAVRQEAPRAAIGFDQIAGVDEYLVQLREMIILPLVHPELFGRIGVQPPRGVLFHGPPGTGKTLLARILASACSKAAGRPVAFFHRNGSECLSKWIGEAEQNLAKLFKQARQQAPAIIFFDEIDGMAPDRSGVRAQDQSHISLVSMLLSLMDGLEDRGSVVVIGATNRLEAVDPALRRPGRFDKEFYFGLPDEPTRLAVLRICMQALGPLDAGLLAAVARETDGYSGAELKGLCTEAALVALRRLYPALYAADGAAPVHVEPLVLVEEDFRRAFNPRRPVNAGYAEGLPGPLAELLEPVLGEMAGAILARAGAPPPQGAWRRHAEVPIRNPIVAVDFGPEPGDGGLRPADLARMQRRFLASLAHRLAPAPTAAVLLDCPALVREAAASPAGSVDMVLLGKYRPESNYGRVVVCPDLGRLYSLVSGPVFDAWLEDWSMAETARLLLVPGDLELGPAIACSVETRPLALGLLDAQAWRRFAHALRPGAPGAGPADLADVLGVVRDSLDSASPARPGAAAPPLATFYRACALYYGVP